MCILAGIVRYVTSAQLSNVLYTLYTSGDDMYIYDTIAKRQKMHTICAVCREFGQPAHRELYLGQSTIRVR